MFASFTKTTKVAPALFAALLLLSSKTALAAGDYGVPKSAPASDTNTIQTETIQTEGNSSNSIGETLAGDEIKQEATNKALIQSDDPSTLPRYHLVDKKHKVEDLAYGEILLKYYSNDDYDALIRAKIALDRNELATNVEHTKLLLAQLYILQGLPSHAQKVLEEITKSRVSQATLNAAYFQMARIHLYQGDLSKAQKILETNISDLNPGLELDRKVLLTKVYTLTKNSKALKKILAQVTPEETRNAYSKYNLATAGLLIEEDSYSLPLLEELSQGQHEDLESRSLRDQANLKLGRYYLEQDQLEKAREYLNAVSYQGPHSSAALYHLAWIELELNEPKKAFSLWVDLTKRNPTDPYVGKSFLIRPYTLEKLKSEHLALTGYFRAAELYEKLIADVDKTIEIVNSENWLNKLKPPTLDATSMYQKVAKRPGWVKTQRMEANFLIDLYASDEFAVMYQNFWEMELLLQDLGKHDGKFEIFKVQQNSHEEKFADLIPEAKAALYGEKNHRILERLEEIRDEMNRITAENNFLAAPSEDQAFILDRIGRMHAILENEPDDKWQGQRRYLEKLQSIQAWDMARDSNERQWELRVQYRELVKLLAIAREHSSNIKSGIKTSDYYKSEVKKLDQFAAHLDLALKQIELLSLKHQKLLRTEALSILNERKDEYESLRVKAMLAAARLQDSVVTGGKR